MCACVHVCMRLRGCRAIRPACFKCLQTQLLGIVLQTSAHDCLLLSLHNCLLLLYYYIYCIIIYYLLLFFFTICYTWAINQPVIVFALTRVWLFSLSRSVISWYFVDLNGMTKVTWRFRCCLIIYVFNQKTRIQDIQIMRICSCLTQ